jgi:Lrp/AsnC family transcriptional regulator, leucine-responsive regulatory protein
MADMDPVDIALLDALQNDSRRSLAELGKLAGLSISATKDRIDKLQARGVIAGFHARLEPEAVGLDLLAFLFVAWSDPATEKPFLERIATEPSVLECHHVTGVWNYVLKVRVRNPRLLQGLLTHVVKAVPGVERTETIIALSSAKETAVLPTQPPTWASEAN